MKKILITLIGFFLIVSIEAQITRTKQNVQTIISQRNIYLNGGARASVGGKSRTTILINLPANTVSWYYSFSTSPGESGTKNLNLLTQLSTLVIDPSGLTARAVSGIQVPSGSSSIDAYLLDQENSDLFIKKVDNNGGSFTYLREGLVTNTKQAVVPINYATKGLYYIGLKNPSSLEGINITIEVVAIVEEKIIDNTLWANDTKERFYETYYQGLKKANIDDAVAKDLANCIVTKITAEKTPDQFDGMTQGERETFISTIYTSCNEKNIVHRTPEQEKAKTWGELGWKSYENGDLDKCIEYSKKALLLDNTMGWVKSNIGLCYLIKGADTIAIDYYVDALSDIKNVKIKSSLKFQLQGTIDDINNAQKKYPDFKGNKDIISLFEEELKKY